jgi:guanine deaminase
LGLTFAAKGFIFEMGRRFHMSQEYFLERAIALAEENARSGRGGPFGALVVRNGSVIAEAVNLVTETNDPTAHAEIVAIRRACEKLGDYQLTGCELFTSCEPCPMCLGAIYWTRPNAVYYAATHEDAASAGFDDSLIYEELRRAPAERRIPTLHLKSDRAIAPFNAWRVAEGRIPY